MSMYYICTNIPQIPPLPLSVRLKHPSLSPDRESAPHCRTIALGWYISITLVITYSVIHSTYDSYAKLNNSLKLHCIGIDLHENNLCIQTHHIPIFVVLLVKYEPDKQHFS